MQQPAGAAPRRRRPTLQAAHIEVALLSLSGLRLCAALAFSKPGGGLLDSLLLLVTHIASLLLEFHPASHIASRYVLRRSASHGVAQGVLAAPSVLAALAAAAPTVGGWQPPLRGSCCAALAVLAAIHAQSRLAGAFNPKAAAATTGAVTSEQQQQCEPLQLKGSSVGSSVILPGGIAAAILALLASAAAQQQQLQQLWRPGAAAAVRRCCVHAAGPALWAGLAAGSFCGSLHMLPGCFSLGEAALLAHGVTALALAAGAAVQHAALFVPHVICQQLPQRAAATLAAAGGCSVAAHQQALSLQRLPTAIVLILAATLAACVLLRLLWLGTRSLHAGLRGLCSSGPTAQAQDNKAAAANGHSRAATGAGHTAAAAMRSSSPAATTRWQSLACVPVAAAASLLLAAAICVLLLWLCCAAAWTLLAFLPAVPGRVQVLLFWVSLLAVTLPGLRLWCARSSVPQIIVRKVYHLLALGLFVPVFFWDLQLLGLSLAIAFAALVLLEVLRCLRLPLLGRAVQQYMQKFVDERDSGVIYITHFTLLLGLAVPMWLVLAMPDIHSLVATQAALHEQGCQRPQGAAATAAAPPGGVCPHCSAPPHQHGDLVSSSSSGGSCQLGASQLLAGALSIGSAWRSPAAALALVLMGLSGTIIIGVGDTAASLFGQLFGRRPIHAGSKKTVEGTVAGIVLSLGSWLLLLHAVGLLPPLASARGAVWAAQLVAATVGAGLLEAATSQLDNILLPLWYAPHVLLIGW